MKPQTLPECLKQVDEFGPTLLYFRYHKYNGEKQIAKAQKAISSLQEEITNTQTEHQQITQQSQQYINNLEGGLAVTSALAGLALLTLAGKKLYQRLIP